MEGGARVRTLLGGDFRPTDQQVVRMSVSKAHTYASAIRGYSHLGSRDCPPHALAASTMTASGPLARAMGPVAYPFCLSRSQPRREVPPINRSISTTAAFTPVVIDDLLWLPGNAERRLSAAVVCLAKRLDRRRLDIGGVIVAQDHNRCR
jgi:hypothetical protein